MSLVQAAFIGMGLVLAYGAGALLLAWREQKRDD